MPKLDPKTTALILIDLQKGITRQDRAPHTADKVVENAKTLAKHFRDAHAPVVLVNVGWSRDFKDVLSQEVDQPTSLNNLPPDFSELVDGLAKPGDILITKRQWGAFHATELDLQLRRRGIKTIVLAGIATNMGVESTARQAWELGYSLLIVEDATTSLSADMHHFAVGTIFPRISRVVNTKDISLS